MHDYESFKSEETIITEAEHARRNPKEVFKLKAKVMNSIFRNVLAVIAGVVIGSIVNMGLITISGKVIPPPAGVDVTEFESLKSSMHLFESKHFIFPFLAHALGSLVGAYVASVIAASHKMKFALGIGAFFLMGGIINVFILPSPTWFAVLDLVCAYIPMGWLGSKLAERSIIRTERVRVGVKHGT